MISFSDNSNLMSKMNKLSKLNKIKEDLIKREKSVLSQYACLSCNAIRRRKDFTADSDHRLPFAIDTDRILYSRGYTRYIDKTQVFSLVPNDLITHRALHVQFLSKISRTIGTFLRLNLDLIEAIALGHDIGHPPFGHDGEKMLSKISKKMLNKPFLHNLQSIRIFEHLEKGGSGLNLTVQVLDGILLHNGEEDFIKTKPTYNFSFENLDKEIMKLEKTCITDTEPATLEGCLVKICDTISYVGRDLEDAITLKLFSRDMIPKEIKKVLGDTAGKIVYNLVVDVICESYDKDYIGFSQDTAEALYKLKNFNRKHIYNNKMIKTQHKKIEKMMELLFESCLEDLEKESRKSPIYRDFLNNMNEQYISSTLKPQIVLDYIAGMTDRYFREIFEEKFVAEKLPRYFNE